MRADRRALPLPPKLFAQFLRKSFCAPPNPTRRRNYFHGRRTVSAGRSRARIDMPPMQADVRAHSAHANKSTEKKRFRKRRRGDVANSSMRSRANRAADPLVWADPVASGLENILQKVLTVEKTVIRFRAADMTCGRE
jgi:hypothetical protein